VVEDRYASAVPAAGVQFAEADAALKVRVHCGIPASDGPHQVCGWIGRVNDTAVRMRRMCGFLEQFGPGWIAVEPIIAIAYPVLSRARYAGAIVWERCQI